VKNILVIASALFAINAQAQIPIAQCTSQLSAVASWCDSVMFQQMVNKASRADAQKPIRFCKDVSFDQVNENGAQQQVSETIYFLAGGGIAIENKLSGDACKLHYLTLTDSPAEAKDDAGRVIIRSDSGRIYVITRLGTVKEIYESVINGVGRPFTGISSIKIDVANSTVILTRKNQDGYDYYSNSSTEIPLSETDLFARVNNAALSEIIGL
jgi:hypothetical protein